MKKYMFLILLLFVFSCDKEDKILEIEEEEEEILVDTTEIFQINNIYPPYAFWESGIRITLDKNEKFNPSKLEIYFNDTLLPHIEVNNTGPQYIILTKMITDSYSDSFKFIYNDGDTIINLASPHYEIVNSEVRIDSIEKSNCGEWRKVYGKGFRYFNHISLGLGRTNDILTVVVPMQHPHPRGIMLNDNEAQFKFVKGHNFAFSLSVSDSILSPRHPYPTNRSFMLTDYKEYLVVNRPEVNKVVRKGNTITVESKYWFVLLEEDIIKFGNIKIDRDKISFSRHRRYWTPPFSEIIEVYSYLYFTVPENAQNNTLEIEYGCSERSYTTEVPKGTDYTSAEFSCGELVCYYTFNSGNSAFSYDTISTFQHNIQKLEATFNKPDIYSFTDKTQTSISGSTKIYELDLIELTETTIKFQYKYQLTSYVSGNNGSSYFESNIIEYEGPCIRNETNNQIEITLTKEHIDNMKVSGDSRYSKTLGGQLSNKSINRYEVDDNWDLKIIFEKW